MQTYPCADNGSCPVATADLTTMLIESYLREGTADRLFAWSILDERIVTWSPGLATFVRGAVTTYGQ